MHGASGYRSGLAFGTRRRPHEALACCRKKREDLAVPNFGVPFRFRIAKDRRAIRRRTVRGVGANP